MSNIHDVLQKANLWKGEAIDSEKYFEIGDLTEIVVSNSLMSWANPDEGGSFLKIEQFFTQGEERKYINHIEKGRMLHKWLQYPSRFVVHEGTRPSDTICSIMEALAEIYQQSIVSSDELAPQGLITILDLMRESLIQIARTAGWQDNWGDDAVFRNLKKDGEGYFNFLLENSDKQILTPDVKQALHGMQQSIYNSDMRDWLLDDDFEGATVYKELALFVQINGIWCKILIDNLCVDEENKILVITDIKSTGFPISTFMGYKKFGLSEDGRVILKHYDGAFQSRRYYRQIGFYDMVLKEVIKELEGWRVCHQFAVVESKDLFESKEIMISDPSWITVGRSEATQCMSEIQRYIVEKELNEE